LKNFFITFLLLNNTVCLANPSKDAFNTAARAFYQYEHWDQDVNQFLQHYEHKLTPQQREIGGILGYIANVIVKKQISVTFRF